MAVQWLRLHAYTEGGTDSIPGWGTKIPQAMECGQKKKERKKERNRFFRVSYNGKSYTWLVATMLDRIALGE